MTCIKAGAAHFAKLWGMNRPRPAARFARELRTAAAMIKIYCRSKHRSAELCGECRELLQFVAVRLDRCRRLPDKPPCRDCSTHCYGGEMRARIKAVMRFAGPRMLLVHPLLALRHTLDGWRRRVPA